MDLFDSQVICEWIKPETKGLLSITAQSDLDVFHWIRDNKQLLEKNISQFGGVLLRNFHLHSVSEFNRLVQVICPNLLDYIYRSTPRTKLGGKIYTATEYPADRVIPFHNENSYSRSWPEKIFFFSVIVATDGGETPVADSRRVYKKINKLIRKKFEQKGILYVRNYTTGIDLSWQEVFQTEQKEIVNNFCKDNNIQYEWREERTVLTTKQVCQASIMHPITKDVVWFNQAHLFHISALQEEERAILLKELGEESLPRNTFYGDGEKIEVKVLEHIRAIYQEEKIKFQWKRGDVMILDNLLFAHSTEPYKGERKIAVAMA